MKLEQKDKLIILKTYDKILSKNRALMEILDKNQMFELALKSEYSKQYYDKSMEFIAEVIRRVQKTNPLLTYEDIFEYIVDPDFRVDIDIANHPLSSPNRTIQDTAIIKDIYYRIIEGKPEKIKLEKDKFFQLTPSYKQIPLIRFERVDLSDELHYVKDEIVFVADKVYEIEKEKALKDQKQEINSGRQIDDKEADILKKIWISLIQKEYFVYQKIGPKVYSSIKDLNETVKAYYNFNVAGRWYKSSKPLVIDNRRHDENLVNENNPIGTITLQSKLK